MSMWAAFLFLLSVTGFYTVLSAYLVYRLVKGYLADRLHRTVTNGKAAVFANV